MNRRIHLAGERLDESHFISGFLVGFEAGHGFNAPDAGGNRAFADDTEQTNLAGRACVRAAAKLHGITVQLRRVTADLNDANNVAVFLAEELHHVLAQFHVSVGNFRPRNAGVFDDALVDEFLDIGDLLRRQRGAAEVEGELFGADVGAFLDGVIMASLALMASVTWSLGRDAIIDVPTALLVLASIVLLVRFRLNSLWLVLGGALAGFLIYRTGI